VLFVHVKVWRGGISLFISHTYIHTSAKKTDNRVVKVS